MISTLVSGAKVVRLKEIFGVARRGRRAEAKKRQRAFIRFGG
jgi:hypothetical protein